MPIEVNLRGHAFSKPGEHTDTIPIQVKEALATHTHRERETERQIRVHSECNAYALIQSDIAVRNIQRCELNLWRRLLTNTPIRTTTSWYRSRCMKRHLSSVSNNLRMT
jgi:hypothetical protein